tara:strand:- start:1084 stop:2184 length:1101 start_codon:yes stop_codon:yes gene_type:complete
MKIVLTSNSSWNLYNFRFHLIKTLLKQKHEVIIISSYDNYSNDLIKLGCKFKKIKVDQRGISVFRDFILFIKYFFLIKQIKPDYLLSFTIKPNIYGSLASNFLNVKTINTITGLGSVFLKKNLVTIIVELLYFISLKKSYKIFFHNKEDLKFFLKRKIISKQSNSVIKGSGIDLKEYKFSQMKFKKNVINFLFIGRIIREKGFFDLIKAIKIIKKKYNNINFEILGNTSTNFSNDVTLSKLNIWQKEKLIIYHGYQRDVRKYINNCHCLILPSYREGLSRAIIECIVKGRPIISNNVPGCKDLIQHNKNGFLCKKNDFIDLSNMIEKFINLNNNQKKAMGIYGYKKYALDLDIDKVNAKYIDLIYK